MCFAITIDPFMHNVPFKAQEQAVQTLIRQYNTASDQGLHCLHYIKEPLSLH